MIALVYKTTPEGQQVIVGRIRIVAGRLVGEPPDDPSIAMILGQYALRHDTGEIVYPTPDPQRFLEALPAAYTGTMLRVGLVTEDPEGSP